MARAAIIRHIFSQGDHQQVLILGYSCSDVFDLSPQIEALAENFKQVSLVQHSYDPKIEDMHDQEQKNPFKAFDNGTRLFFNTSDLVRTLWKLALREIYPTADADQNMLKTSPDWKAKVQAWYTSAVQNHSKVIKAVMLGKIFLAICEWQVAIGLYGHVLAYAREHADDREGIVALNGIGSAYLHLGEYLEAIGFYEQAVEIARRIGDVRGARGNLGNMGNAYALIGMKDKARQCFDKSKAILESPGP